MSDLGFEVKQVLIIDAEATEILHRHEIENMKHIDVAHLWLQDEVKSNRWRVRRVKKREDNLAAIETKALSNIIIRKHATPREYSDAHENLEVRKCHGALGWHQQIRAVQLSRKTSLESTGGHARQQERQQPWRGQPSPTERGNS